MEVIEVSAYSENQCPTLDNHINCSECTLECKLRMQPDSKEVEIPPESLLNTIYY